MHHFISSLAHQIINTLIHRSMCLGVLFNLLISASVFSQSSEFYGMTSEGGEFNAGTIFKMNRNDTILTVIKNFEIEFEGIQPFGDLCEANNGKLYGLTYYGGIYNLGVLFEWDPVTNIYIKKIDFNGTENGSQPKGSLIKAENGKLYGMTSAGGAQNRGVLFEWDPAQNSFLKKLDFEDYAYERSTNDLMQAYNGKLYGMNRAGSYDDGNIFEWDPVTNIYTIKFHFDEYTTGEFPLGKLTQAGNGKLYGIVQYGGRNQKGVVFVWNPASGDFSIINDFDDSSNIGYPKGSLVLADNGKLYGMTEEGGVGSFGYGSGIIYEIDPNTDVFIEKFAFSDFFKTGIDPDGALIKGNSGKLYGMTWEGGIYHEGILFEWDPLTNNFIKKVDLDCDNYTGLLTPNSLLQASDGNFYGMYYFGGRNKNGYLFKWGVGETALTKKFSFNDAPDGRSPKGDLVLAGNGKLYGMTPYGGKYNEGILFEIDTSTNTFIRRLDFNNDTTGSNPFGSFLLAKNGKLYGMTSYGGANDDGVLFEWDPVANEYSKKSDFEYRSSGGGAKSHLIEATNGKFYGVSQYGGNHCYDGRGGYYCYGVLFEWDPVTFQFSKKHDFGSSAGTLPFGALLEAPNSKFYGMTSDYHDVLYEWDPVTDSYSVKQEVHFNEMYSGSLFLAGNGKIYGMTSNGGNYYKGDLFEWDLITNSYISKLNFYGTDWRRPSDGILGSNPYGTPIQGSNGKIYGMTKTGGLYDKGVIFEWDPVSESYHKLIDFNGIEKGSLPYGSLLEISHAITDTLYAEACNYYTSPSGKYTFTKSGIYKDFLTSRTGCDSVLTIFLTLKSSKSTIDASDCHSYTSPSGKYRWTASGVYYDTIPNSVGCDSIITVNLIIMTTRSIIDQMVCESYTSPSGRYIWTEEGVYTDTIPNAAGCDSIITINLRIKHSSANSINSTVCNIYTSPGGKLWTSSGVYTDTIPNSAGCDSIITINLTINNGSASSTDVIVCHSYTSPSGKYTWTNSGVFTDTILNSYGCDSIMTIHLTVKPSSTNTISTTVCNTYTSASGKIWTASGVYTDTIPNAVGCDSIITINLIVNNTTTSTIQLKACHSYISPSGKYVWEQNGIYTDTIPNVSGCDSLITIELNILNVDTTLTFLSGGTEIISNDALANHQWIDCDNNYSWITGETGQSFKPGREGNYAVIVLYGWCTDTSECVSVDLTNLSPNPSESGITLYPNPTNGRFTIDLGRVYMDATITITELDGSLIQKKQMEEAQQIEINLNAPAGIYLLTITTAKENIVFRILKNY
jgi:uncharacterized repeat protein (TIGR03803 family)